MIFGREGARAVREGPREVLLGHNQVEIGAAQLCDWRKLLTTKPQKSADSEGVGGGEPEGHPEAEEDAR
jgi:hypothetical protein